MRQGDVIRADNGMEFVVGRPLCYRGREGCTDALCTRLGDECYGWHCATCHEPTSPQGHDCPRERGMG